MGQVQHQSWYQPTAIFLAAQRRGFCYGKGSHNSLMQEIYVEVFVVFCQST